MRELPHLLIADLAHALNGEDDAVVTVHEVFYSAFITIDHTKTSRVVAGMTVTEGPTTRDTPGFTVVFSKAGKRYTAQFTQYAGWELQEGT